MKNLANIFRDLIDGAVLLLIILITLAFVASPLLLIGLLIWRGTS